MKLRIVCAAALLLGLVGSSARAEDDNAKKIVGTWELTKSSDKDKGPPPGTVVEFTKDGKLLLSIKLGDKVEKLEGTYKVEKDKLTVKIKGPDGQTDEDTDEIAKLTDDTLELKNVKEKMTAEFKKKK